MSAEIYVPALGRSYAVLINAWPDTGELIGMSRSQVYEALKSGEIPSFRVAGRIKIPSAALLAKLGIEVSNIPAPAAGAKAPKVSS